jgi:hypothetical protein
MDKHITGKQGLLDDLEAVAPPALFGDQWKVSLNALGPKLHADLFLVSRASLYGKPFGAAGG